MAVLVFGLVATAAGVIAADRHTNRQAEQEFRVEAEAALASVEQRLLIYEETLRGLRALFAASDTVDRSEFHAYVEIENILGRLPGIQALEFTRRLTADELGAYTESVRADTSVNGVGYPEFVVYPVTDAVEHFVVDFIEPMQGNEVAHGFDLGSNPARLRAIEEARDTGAAVATEPITLVQDAEEQAGFLVLLPVYDNDLPQATPADRRAALQGFVNSVFRADDMFHDVLADDRDVELEVYDAGVFAQEDTGERLEGRLLFDSDATWTDSPTDQARNVTFETEVGGRRWVLVITDDDAAPSEAILRWTVGLLGLLATVVLAASVLMLAHSRDRALRLAAELAHRASHDDLTGLANRALLLDSADRALARAARHGGLVGAIFIDLDDFKAVNDTFGHDVGDALLCAVAEAVSAVVRSADVVSRFAGDEFVVLVEDLDSVDHGRLLADRVRAVAGAVTATTDRRSGSTASVGFAFSRDGDLDAATLISNADAAMYAAKYAGGDLVEVFDAPGRGSTRGRDPRLNGRHYRSGCAGSVADRRGDAPRERGVWQRADAGERRRLLP